MKWSEATLYIFAWLSVTAMVFSVSRCCSDEAKYHAQIMSSQGLMWNDFLNEN
jgi:hypothetical protein